jgi:hypothetical protein
MSTSDIKNRINNTFIKLSQTKGVKDLVKEAKRVKYKVKTDSGDDFGKGDIWRYEVTDEGNLVFKAMLVRPNIWAVTFSKDYWQEPAVG